MNNKFLTILGYLSLFLIAILLGFAGIFYLIKFADQSNTGKEPKDNKPPIIDESPQNTTQSPTTTNKSLNLIDSSEKFEINGNPYSPEVYKKLSKRLALIGNFATAILKIKASLPNSDEHFLSINIGEESGVFNAIRNSSEGLDISLTKENLGIFDKEHPIDLSIDLLGQQTLATSKEEFLSTRLTTKLVKFWDFIAPPTPLPSVNRILFAPFNKDGNYEGIIENLAFEYSCKEKNECKAVLCNNDELVTECLKRNFGQNAMDEWMKWYQKVNK